MLAVLLKSAFAVEYEFLMPVMRRVALSTSSSTVLRTSAVETMSCLVIAVKDNAAIVTRDIHAIFEELIVISREDSLACDDLLRKGVLAVFAQLVSEFSDSIEG